jgi:hypothetical protein
MASWIDNSGNLWTYGGIDAAGNAYTDVWEFNATTLEWVWMAGPSAPNLAGVYGTQGTPSASNFPGLRSGTATWKDLDGNFWLFGGHGSDANGSAVYLNDLWKFSPSTLQWTWMGGSSTAPSCPSTNSCGFPGVYGALGVAAPGNIPPGRDGAAAWTDTSGNFWLFGGRIYVVYLNGWTGYENDLWKYSPATNQWTWMGGQNSLPSDCGLIRSCGWAGIYGTQLVPSASNMPGARDAATAWTDASGNFWLFGGEGFDASDVIGYPNDLWKYDPNAGTWEWMSGSNDLGGTRYTGSPSVYGTRGTPSTANHPSGRASHQSWTDFDGNLWLYGGSGYGLTGGIFDTGILGDLWRFNPATNEWTWMTGSSTFGSIVNYGTFAVPDPANDPGARIGAVSWSDSAGNLWMFGGSSPANNYSQYNDGWEYLLKSPPHAVPPTFSPAGGSLTGAQSLTITAATPNSTVYYTIDGSVPSTSSTTYSGPINIGHSQTVNAIAVAQGYATSGVSAANFLITPIQPVISWPQPTAITYGTPLNSTQLNAITTAPGTLSYSPSAGTVLWAGTYTLTVTFTPDTDSGYASATKSVTLVVNRAVPTITWPTPTPISYGTPLSGTQLNATASVPGTFVYSPAAGTILAVGSQTLRATFTPTDSTNYTSVSASVVITVRNTSAISWPTPAAIPYGTPLSATQLNATAIVPGTFVYSPAAGTVLTPGAHTLAVTFTPTDTNNYTSATASVSLMVNQAAPELAWLSPSPIVYGTPLSSAQLNASSNVPGTFAYSPAAGTILQAGQQTLSVVFTPTDSVNYSTSSTTVTLTVNKATSVVTWSTPAAINYGTSLSGTQLNATASVPGTFVYSPAAGTVLPVGSNTLSVTFTTTDTIDYTSAAGSVTLVVNPYNPTPVLTSISPAISAAGSSAFTLTVAGLAFQSSSTIFWGATALPTQFVSATQLTAQIPAANIASAGSASVTVQTPAPGGGASSAMMFEIDSNSGATPPSFPIVSTTISAGATATYPVTLPSSATNVTATCLNLPPGATCSYSAAAGTVTITTSPTTPKGSYQITVVFNETLPGVASAAILLPFLVLPIFFLRRRLPRNGWMFAGIVLALVITAGSITGCGGGGGGASSSTPSPTHQATSSATVTLTVQ